ncbi:MAG: ComEC/Rec2 family competence protein [Vicinamibacterales bacterium]
MGLLPAICLAAGASAALWTGVGPGARWLLPLLLLGAAVAWRAGRAARTRAWLAAGFACAGLVLGAHARDAALHAPLRAVVGLPPVSAPLGASGAGPASAAGKAPAAGPVAPGVGGVRVPVTLVVRLLEDAAMTESDSEADDQRPDGPQADSSRRDDSPRSGQSRSEQPSVVTLRAKVLRVEAPLAGGPPQALPVAATTTAAGGVLLTVNGEVAVGQAGAWRRGRTLRLPVALRRPPRYLNDGVPDAERALALAGISLVGTVKSGLLVEVVAPARALEEWAGQLREDVRARLARHVGRHAPLSAAIARAVVIGDRAGLPHDVEARLQAAGTYHVLAISGGNVAVLVVSLSVPLALLGLRGRVPAFVALAGVVAYALVVSAEASVWRATLMAVLHLVGRALDQRGTPLHLVGVAAAGMLVVAPLDVASPAFLLTFLATIALLQLPRVPARFWPRRAWLRWVVASCAASVAVELTLVPLATGVFHRVGIAGPLLNLVAVPVMGVVQLAGFVVALPWTPDVGARAAGLVVHLGATALVESARLIEWLPWLTWRVPPPAPVLVVVAGLLLGMSLTGPPWARGRWRWRAGALAGYLACAGLMAAGLVPAHRALPPPGGGLPPETWARLTVFDVGQGEALLLEGAGGLRLLVDAGGSLLGRATAFGERTLGPALWGRGISRLDHVVLSHGDGDHVGGAPFAIATFAPRAVWRGVPVPGDARMAQVEAAARAAGAVVGRVVIGEDLVAGPVRVRVLWPPEPDWERRTVRNDDSVVLEVVCGGVTLLLTGDIGAAVEETILPHLTPAALRVLKVAHHGSRTSTSEALVRGWRPQVALVSSGRQNTFGHPAPEVIERLRRAGVRVWRTDLEGQLTLETDGRRVWTRTALSPAATPLPVPPAWRR